MPADVVDADAYQFFLGMFRALDRSRENIPSFEELYSRLMQTRDEGERERVLNLIKAVTEYNEAKARELNEYTAAFRDYRYLEVSGASSYGHLVQAGALH
ncbi:hypothetical protein B0H19DRAFT_1100335 [Mycena capillaripes]|nr:hypothetical protein B0H19DRAFT_1100335 [Mycena capillaripes]